MNNARTTFFLCIGGKSKGVNHVSWKNVIYDVNESVPVAVSKKKIYNSQGWD